MFRGSVKSTGYPLHSPVSTSLPLQCATVCHHISTVVYKGTLPNEAKTAVDPITSHKKAHTVHKQTVCAGQHHVSRKAYVALLRFLVASVSILRWASR